MSSRSAKIQHLRSLIRCWMFNVHVAAAAKDAVDKNMIAGPSVRVLGGRGYTFLVLIHSTKLTTKLTIPLSGIDDEGREVLVASRNIQTRISQSRNPHHESCRENRTSF